ncbi:MULTISPECIES: methylmalonyl Co-A mutase-associated GTPase MeaB [Prauserella salsuginis group]|uniref:Methylmalonyl Co-A mutase-associated GTPase MeaB n=1 Tax=Prauserella salsuginis TaxID=387889 RepID=A0ABW6G635_9PSEU|nr:MULTISPECIES: methylmalonyl Co-A mutase-associated GTPase MeaB [Prauserella salsuginis group]MCR3719299.1 LAO/AO transport system kinase [Prauserella flava]MCR3735688.1 LAO/AO transport system kinase [Prauserella salsuginis]
MTAPKEIVDAVLEGRNQAVARMLTFVERRSDGVDDALAVLHRAAGSAHVLGLTGPPGSGKSTLVSALARHYRSQGRTVGVLAVDPSSVFSGGAILGDRIRMSDHGDDAGVFIRSVATRGALGGLSRACLDAITVLDAAGTDVVILETVGVGQAEVDVISAAQTVAVVSVPGMGDDVQAIKAGLLEVADVHVVNKADRDGASRTVAELREMLRLSHRTAGQWNVPIHQTVAANGDGVADLAAVFAAHLDWMTEHGERERRARRNAATRIRWVAEELVLDELRPGVAAFDHALDEVTAHRTDPLSAARQLVGR